MNRYVLYAHVTVSAYTVVDAESEAEAIKIADSRDATLSTQWTRDKYPEEAFEQWLIEEADGMPQNIGVSLVEDCDEGES
jgi:hypothetical protein